MCRAPAEFTMTLTCIPGGWSLAGHLRGIHDSTPHTPSCMNPQASPRTGTWSSSPQTRFFSLLEHLPHLQGSAGLPSPSWETTFPIFYTLKIFNVNASRGSVTFPLVVWRGEHAKQSASASQPARGPCHPPGSLCTECVNYCQPPVPYL